MEIDTERLATIKTLYSGAHDPDGKMCVMEAVAYVAREPWSDHPACVSPVIAAFARAWNDGLPDAERNSLLMPMIPKFVGTIGSDALENRRATMAADWLIRVYTPAWLRLAGLTSHADTLANLPEIIDFAKVPALMPALGAARKDAAAAWSAARDAAPVAARSAALVAARSAALAAALVAARVAARIVAWDAARDAAGDAAWDAAWSAAAAAAGDKLEPTVKELQASAIGLLNRMIDTK